MDAVSRSLGILSNHRILFLRPDERGWQMLLVPFKTFRALLGLCQRRPCGVEPLLLPEDNPHVERELLGRTASGKVSDPTGWVLKHQKA